MGENKPRLVMELVGRDNCVKFSARGVWAEAILAKIDKHFKDPVDMDIGKSKALASFSDGRMLSFVYKNAMVGVTGAECLLVRVDNDIELDRTFERPVFAVEPPAQEPATEEPEFALA